MAPVQSSEQDKLKTLSSVIFENHEGQPENKLRSGT